MLSRDSLSRESSIREFFTSGPEELKAKGQKKKKAGQFCHLKISLTREVPKSSKLSIIK